MRKRSWTNEQLEDAVRSSRSIRQVLGKLGLVEAGGNYEQIKRAVFEHAIDASHLTGRAWNKGKKHPGLFKIPLQEILVEHSLFQPFKLKKRLFFEGLKKPECELCGWAEQSIDGRTPVELDHINGNRHDNRIENLRILCPNCHSLQVTHRGKNKKGRWRNWYTRNT